MTAAYQAIPINTALKVHGSSTLDLRDDRRKCLVGTWKIVSWMVEGSAVGQEKPRLREESGGLHHLLAGWG